VRNPKSVEVSRLCNSALTQDEQQRHRVP
jgi:hypothetical protein